MIKIRSPGRVNLIGEHTDYTGGYVMPMAVDLYTVVEGKKNDIVDVYSSAFDERKRFKPDDLTKCGGWLDHVKGVYSVLRKEGYEVGGIKAKIRGDLPIGSGLSASASFELGVMFLLDDLYNLELSREEMALLCQGVENDYVGVSCGIMDQFAISLSKKDHVLHLDTGSLEYEYVKFPENLIAVVFHTGVERELKSSEYNQRRSKVEEALDSLGEEDSKNIDPSSLKCLPRIQRKRLGYIMRENDRVVKTKEALRSGDLEKVGEILTKAHRDISKNYEASCEELDFIVEKAVEHGALGARLTGAGWGGSVIALLRDKDVELFAEDVFQDYKEKFSYPGADYFLVEPTDGVEKDVS
ncbi:MAG: galactokinase [Candidatus Saliniplasma sp.]